MDLDLTAHVVGVVREHDPEVVIELRTGLWITTDNDPIEPLTTGDVVLVENNGESVRRAPDSVKWEDAKGFSIPAIVRHLGDKDVILEINGSLVLVKRKMVKKGAVVGDTVAFDPERGVRRVLANHPIRARADSFDVDSCMEYLLPFSDSLAGLITQRSQVQILSPLQISGSVPPGEPSLKALEIDSVIF